MYTERELHNNEPSLENPLSAQEVKNPHMEQLREIANEYSHQLQSILPIGAQVELGGSLRSNTALKGHNDIDLRVLLPVEYSSEEKIREISELIDPIIPFQKDRPVGSTETMIFAVMHQLEFTEEGIEGQIEIEVSVRPMEGYVGFTKFQETFPSDMQDQLIVYKDMTRSDKAQYKKVKEQFYGLTRSLYNQNYWDENGNIIGDQLMFDQACQEFWGNTLEEILAKKEVTI